MRPNALADALWGATAVLTVTAALLVVWPAGVPRHELPRVVPAMPTATSIPKPVVDAVLRADVFAPGHVPPRVRWSPPPVDTMPPGLAPDPAAAAEDRAVDAPRFYGTIVDADGAAALLRFPGAPAASLVHEGVRVRGWRVARVTPERAVLVAPGGTRVTVRLSRTSHSAPVDSAPPPAVP
jgi:hypothetical protein